MDDLTEGAFKEGWASRRLQFPAGQVLTTISGISNRPLRYFVPPYLSSLLECSGSYSQLREADPLSKFVAAALSRVASSRGVGDYVDIAQAQRFAKVALGVESSKDRTSILKQAVEISRKNDRYRSEIMFAGAHTASDASIIFAPYEAIPELMEDLFSVAQGDYTNCDASVLTALTGYYCVMVHPFREGNGRWSRLVAALIGARGRSSYSPMVGATFQNTCKAWIADSCWNPNESGGIARYLETCLEFEGEVTTHINQRVACSIDSFAATLREACASTRAFNELVTALFSGQEIELVNVRQKIGLSSRAMGGLIERLIGEVCCTTADGKSISMQKMHSSIEKIIAHAKNSILKESKQDA